MSRYEQPPVPDNETLASRDALRKRVHAFLAPHYPDPDTDHHFITLKYNDASRSTIPQSIQNFVTIQYPDVEVTINRVTFFSYHSVSIGIVNQSDKEKPYIFDPKKRVIYVSPLRLITQHTPMQTEVAFVDIGEWKNKGITEEEMRVAGTIPPFYIAEIAKLIPHVDSPQDISVADWLKRINSQPPLKTRKQIVFESDQPDYPIVTITSFPK